MGIFQKLYKCHIQDKAVQAAVTGGEAQLSFVFRWTDRRDVLSDEEVHAGHCVSRSPNQRHGIQDTKSSQSSVEHQVRLKSPSLENVYKYALPRTLLRRGGEWQQMQAFKGSVDARPVLPRDVPEAVWFQP